MPYELPADYCSLETRTTQVDIPLSAAQRSLGTVSLTIRELPYAIKKSTELRFLSAQTQLRKTADTFKALSNGEDLTLDKLDEIGVATGNFQAAQLEVIKWGVVDHRAEDFRSPQGAIPFESTRTSLCGESFEVVSPRILRLYKGISPATWDAMHWGFLALLCDAIQLFQVGTIILPEDIYREYEEKDAKKKDSTQPTP